jgi:hypothetical protein
MVTSGIHSPFLLLPPLGEAVPSVWRALWGPAYDEDWVPAKDGARQVTFIIVDSPDAARVVRECDAARWTVSIRASACFGTSWAPLKW